MVEVLWKSISGIINLRLSSSVHIYDVLHGFHVGRGTGTATLEAKLLIAIRVTVLHTIFINLRKELGC